MPYARSGIRYVVTIGKRYARTRTGIAGQQAQHALTFDTFEEATELARHLVRVRAELPKGDSARRHRISVQKIVVETFDEDALVETKHL